MKPDGIFDSRDAAASALANHVVDSLDAAIRERGNASLIVSGGTSPLTTFHVLSQRKLSWRNVTIVPSDDRLVPIAHEDSNEGMIRRELLQNEAAEAQLLSLVESENPDRGQLEALNSRLAKLARPIDLVVLGMGDDGHTASLFPNTPGIDNALRSADECVVQYPPHLKIPRISLTPKFMLDAREIVLLFFGDKKRAIYDRAAGSGDIRDLPVRFVLHQQSVPVNIYWAP